MRFLKYLVAGCLVASVSAQVVPGPTTSGGPTSAIVGQIQTATGGTINNGTLTFTLSQPAVVAGAASIATQQSSCYTANSGNIVGVPDPLVLPITSTSTSAGTLPAGTYYVQTYYAGANGFSAGSPEATVTLSAQGTIFVNAPALQPSSATGFFGVGIGTTSGGEMVQIVQSGWTQYQQSVALANGGPIPTVNTSSCNIYFSDSLVPTGTYYTVNLVNKNGSKIAGYPQSWCTYGGAGGTINVSQGVPTGNCNTNGVFYPTPILSNPPNSSGQSISSPLSLPGGVNATGGTLNGQTINCRNLDNIRCVDAANSANWSGANATAWIASAVSDCGSNSCVVQLFPGLSGFTLPPSLPDGVTIWDMHDDGRLMIYTNPTDNPTGSPGGIGVNMGYNTSTGGCWPTVGPGSNNIVAGYFCASSNLGLQTWGINPLCDIPTSSPDANCWSIEADMGIFCILPCATRNSQYAGVDMVNAGNIPPTFAFRAFANTNGPTAGFNTGFLADGVLNTAYATQSADTGLTLTESVTASGFPQIVSTSATPGPPGNHVHIGQYVSVDSGGSHEDVLVTNLTGVPYSIVGTFTKNHSSGAAITFYTANRVWDPFDFVTRLTPYHLCNIQAWNAANSSVFCGIAVNDPAGVERASEWFDSTGTHNYGDIGTTGWFWKSQGGASLASLTDAGVYAAQSTGVTGPNGTGAQQTSFSCETSAAPTVLSVVATTTNTGLNCLPANAVIDAVVYRITTTITTAVSFTIGDATTAARFCGTQSTLTSGTTGTCFVQADQTGAAGPRQTGAASVRVTTNANPGAGAIRLIVYYHTWTAPTS